MKPQLIPLIVATLTTVATLPISLAAHARPAVQYSCSVRNGIPTTIARTPQGTVSVITWKSNHFSTSGFSPQKRCQVVSARFQKHSNQGSLRYITVGAMNNQNVLCVAQNRGGACRQDGLLLTLEPHDNPQSVLKDLFNVASRASNSPTGRGTGSQVYINMDNYLLSAPNLAPESTEVAPVKTQPQQNSVTPAPVSAPATASDSQADNAPVW